MEYKYRMKGTCASEVSFEIEENVVSNVVFKGGCHGNLKAIARLVEGKDAMEIAQLLEGNTCGFKKTSCADQFSKAIKEALSE